MVPACKAVDRINCRFTHSHDKRVVKLTAQSFESLVNAGVGFGRLLTLKSGLCSSLTGSNMEGRCPFGQLLQPSMKGTQNSVCQSGDEITSCRERENKPAKLRLMQNG